MSFESGKNLAGIGALFLVIGSFVPFLGIVGIILLLVGLQYIARYYNDNKIFQDALYAVIFGIIGIVAAGVALASLFFGGFFLGGDGAFLGLAAGVIIALVVTFIFYILMALYFRKAFDSLTDKSGQEMFRTAGLLLLIGAILTIIIIGLILIFVAWIMATIAFFSMTPTKTPQQPPSPQPPS
ncbi:MAG TPA: DUF996 domain-containing protein [Candidatus Krumholzibacteriaceae bacterium]|nr:DUF996 domain-containing protein [Candidatus Krumholzibacteriaceae bacterium]